MFSSLSYVILLNILLFANHDQMLNFVTFFSLNKFKLAKRFFTLFKKHIGISILCVKKEHKTYEHYEDKHVVTEQQIPEGRCR